MYFIENIWIFGHNLSFSSLKHSTDKKIRFFIQISDLFNYSTLSLNCRVVKKKYNHSHEDIHLLQKARFIKKKNSKIFSASFLSKAKSRNCHIKTDIKGVQSEVIYFYVNFFRLRMNSSSTGISNSTAILFHTNSVEEFHRICGKLNSIEFVENVLSIKN